MSCSICYCPIEGAKVKCTDPRCLGEACTECVGRFIDVVHTTGTGQPLSCARDGCTGEYDQVSIACLPLETLKKYREALMQHFFNANKSEIENREKHKILIDKMKAERMAFYTQNMPKAVLKVATLAFAERLRKAKKAEAAQKASEFGRLCINLFCGGFLNKDLTCCKCNVTFCNLCEEEKNDGHTCKDETKESVALLKKMRACPQCGTRIEKGEGCMAMTCAVCNTNFWYSTGEKGNAGNHGQSIPVIISAFRQLSVEYHSAIPPFLSSKLKEIEARFAEPIASDATLLSTATRARLTERLTDFSSLYSKTLRAKMEKMMLGKKLSQIEKILTEKPHGYLNTLTEALLPKGERKVVMFKTEERDGVVYADEFGVAPNVNAVAKQLGVELFQVVNSLEMNSGKLGEFYLQYE